MRPLAIHQITAIEATPPELATIAATLGCASVCVFTHLPMAAMSFPLVTRALLGAMKARLADTGVGVCNIEFFPLGADVVLEDFLPGLDLGAELGARRLVTHVHDTDAARAVERLARLADLAAERKLDVGLEFMPLTPGCTHIAQAVDLVRRAARPNLGIAVDFLHLVRSGGTPQDVAAVPAELLAYAQLCDGAHLGRSSDYMSEAFDRLAPGAGVFPCAAILDALPRALDLDVEVPSASAQQRGIPALERARLAVEAARRLVEAAHPLR